MTKLDLICFIAKNKVETHWDERIMCIWMHSHDLPDFQEMVIDYIDHTQPESGGIKAFIQDVYICIEMKEVLDYYEIEYSDIFEYEG